MHTRRSEPHRWAGVLFASVPTEGLAGVAPAQTDVTSTRITGSVEDVDGGVLPGATIAVNSVEKTP